MRKAEQLRTAEEIGIIGVIMEIKITAGDAVFHGQLNDSATARLIGLTLPIRARVNRWGKEIYFSIPVEDDRCADARARVEVGELAYWPDGCAFCIFFGRTPASSGDEPAAVSPVNVVGNLVEPFDIDDLDDVAGGAEIIVESAQ